MSADLLRRAAKTLREAAEAATPGPWEHVDFATEGGPLTSDGRQSTYMGCGSIITMGAGVMGGDIAAPSGDLYPRSGYSPYEDMQFVALMHPPVALALAALLDDVAESVEQDGGVIQDSTTQGAVDLARAILREEP